MTSLAFVYLFLVSGLLGFSLSRICPEKQENSQTCAWLIGASLSPAFISIVVLIIFTALNGVAAIRGIYLLAPIILALVLAKLSYNLTRDKPVLPAIVVDVRKLILLVLFFLLTFGTLIGTLVLNSANPQIDHDISVYLIDALSINTHMTESSSVWSGSAIDQPHSLAYSVYLAWGFLFESSPGYGADMTPKMLVAVNHIMALIAIFSLVLRNSNAYWAIVCTAAVLISPVWNYQFYALARDTFYVAPVIALMALLLASSSGKSSLKIAYGAAVGLAAIGSVTGHSLGILGATAVIAGVGLLRLIFERGKIFGNLSFWIAGTIIAIGGGWKLFGLLDSGASRETGFAYPFYTDPFVKNAFLSSDSWGEHPQLADLVKTLFEYNNINPAIAIVGIGLIGWIMYRVPQRLDLSALRLNCLSIFASAIVLFLLVLFFPASLDGLTLSSAFGSNLRYGFLLGITFVLSIILAFQILVRGFPEKFESPLTFTVVFLSAAIVHPVTSGYWSNMKNEIRYASHQEEVCEFFLGNEFRKIFVDGDEYIYVCPGISHYLFTEAGAKLMALQDEKSIAQELTDQNIDAVLLVRSISYWWSGAALYRFLESNWNLVPSNYGTVFVRPER